jgi:hypothetical protein
MRHHYIIGTKWEQEDGSDKSMFPEMLRQLQLVRRSLSDAAVRLFYEFCAQTVLSGRWLCVVANVA